MIGFTSVVEGVGKCTGKERKGRWGGEEEDCVFSSFRKYAYPLAGSESAIYEYATGQVFANPVLQLIVMASAGMEN